MTFSSEHSNAEILSSEHTESQSGKKWSKSIPILTVRHLILQKLWFELFLELSDHSDIKFPMASDPTHLRPKVILSIP